jgi:uncharacterized lipoprotein YbaY
LKHALDASVAALFALALLGAGVVRAGGYSASLSGTATLSATAQPPGVLPTDALFEAELQDISLADAPAVVLGRSRLEPAGQPPFRFRITYDRRALQPGHRYSVRATVRQRGRLLFSTDTVAPVLDGNPRPLRLSLVAVGESAPQSGLPSGPQNNSLFHGLFSYQADAAGFVPCGSGRRLPVAMEGDYRRLEHAYLRAVRQPGQPLLVSVRGRISPRPSLEDSQPPQATLVVERLISVAPGRSCNQLR